MSQFEVEVIAASESHDGSQVATYRLKYPRIVLAELNTHRIASKGSGSSRAIPTETMLREVEENPAMPVRFGGNQSGMQDKGEEHDALVEVPHELKSAFVLYYRGDQVDLLPPSFKIEPREFWRFMAHVNAKASRAYSDAGFHKQIANRLTEPYQWMNTVFSVTDNGLKAVLALRAHPAADPTIAKLAYMIQDTPVSYKLLRPGEWHLPYILPEEEHLPLMQKLILSTARCARVSYAPFDGIATIEKELLRHNLLVKSDPPHMTPTEHPCTPMPGNHGNFRGFKQYRQFLEKGETPC